MATRRRVVVHASVTALVAATLGGAAASAPAPAPSTQSMSTTTQTAAGAKRVAGVELGPVRTLQGVATQLWNPSQLAIGPGGIVVVANEGNFGTTGGSVTVHGPAQSGNAAPQRMIAGSLTGLVQPAGVDVDAAGQIYVADAATDTVSVFAAGATGNVAPLRQLRGAATGLDAPAGLDVDGNRVAVANLGGNGVLVFASNASGDAAPQRHVVGAATRLDGAFRVVLRNGELTVGTWGGRVHTYGSDAHGNAAPVRTLTVNASGPVTGLALDADGRAHVANQYADDPVMVFAAGASGSATPVARLSGELHQLDLPRGLALRPDGRPVVSDEADDAVYAYDSVLSSTPPPPVVRKPGKVRALKVTPGPRKVRRVVRWRAPAADGGAKVTRYRVVVKKGGKTVLTRTVAKRRTVLRRGKLPRGKLVVRVRARNSEGLGPAAVKRFRVRR